MAEITNGKFIKYKYVPPAQPNELIDCTSYVLNFEDRKFIQVGIDPSSHFDIRVDIITASRYVRITPNFLKRILTIMGSILSIILDPPMKTKPPVFIEEDSLILSKMVYKGENVLVIESKSQDGCRVLLSTRDIFALQNLESSIFQSVSRKNVFTRPLILKQILQIKSFLKKNSKTLPKTFKELQTYIMRFDQNLIEIPKNELNFINDIKMMSSKQLAEEYYGKDECGIMVIFFFYSF